MKDEAAFIRFTKAEFSEGHAIDTVNRFLVRDDKASVLAVSHGKMAQNCFKAAQLSPGFAVFAMDRIKPFDEESMVALMKQYKKIVVVEDNFKSAGLFNSIAQFLVEKNIKDVEVISLSPAEVYEDRIGTAEYFEEKHRLSPGKIATFIREIGVSAES